MAWPLILKKNSTTRSPPHHIHSKLPSISNKTRTARCRSPPHKVICRGCSSRPSSDLLNASHGVSRLVQAISAYSVKVRRAPHRHCREAMVHDKTTALHDREYTLTPLPHSSLSDVRFSQIKTALFMCLQRDPGVRVSSLDLWKFMSSTGGDRPSIPTTEAAAVAQ